MRSRTAQVIACKSYSMSLHASRTACHCMQVIQHVIACNRQHDISCKLYSMPLHAGRTAYHCMQSTALHFMQVVQHKSLHASRTACYCMQVVQHVTACKSYSLSLQASRTACHCRQVVQHVIAGKSYSTSLQASRTAQVFSYCVNIHKLNQSSILRFIFYKQFLWCISITVRNVVQQPNLQRLS